MFIIDESLVSEDWDTGVDGYAFKRAYNLTVIYGCQTYMTTYRPMYGRNLWIMDYLSYLPKWMEEIYIQPVTNEQFIIKFHHFEMELKAEIAYAGDFYECGLPLLYNGRARSFKIKLMCDNECVTFQFDKQ